MAEANTSIVISAVDRATEVIRGVTGQFGVLESKWGRLVTALGVTAGVAYLTNLVKQSLQAADAMGDLASAVGVNVETLSRYKLAADTSGTSMEGLANGLKRLSVNMLDTSNNTGEAQDAFKVLGISVTDATGELRSSDAVLLELADRFAGLEDGSGKTALAMKVFGGAGAELIPFLNNGSDGLREMAELAETLGLALDSKTVAAADRTNDIFVVLGQVTTGFGNKILKEVLPTLEGLAGSFLEAAKNSDLLNVAAKVVATGFNVLVTVGAVLWGVIDTIAQGLGGIALALVELAKGNLSRSWDELTLGMNRARNASNSVDEFLEKLWSGTLPKVDEKTIAVSKALTGLAGGAEKAKKGVDEYGKALKIVEDLLSKSLGVNADYVEKLQALELWYSRNRDRTDEYVDAVKALIYAQPQVVEQLNAQNKEFDDAFDKQQKDIEAKEKAIKSIRELVEGIEFEAAALLMSNTERAVAIAMRKIEAEGVKLTAEEYRILAERIRSAVVGREAIAANIESNKQIQSEWQKTSDNIVRALTDSLVRGFDGGKSFAKSLGDYVVNYFKTTVASGIARAITGALGLGGSASALAGGLGAAGGGAAGGGGGLLGGLLGSVGGNFGLGLQNTLFGTGAFGAGGGLGIAAELIGGGQIASGLATGLGAIAPWAAGAAALYGLIKSFSGGETRYGAQYGISGGSAFKIEGPSGGDPRAAAVMASIESTNALLQAAITSFGGAGSSFNISRSGYELSEKSGKRFSEIFVNGVGRRQYGFESNEAVAEAFSADLQRAVLLGLQQADLAQQFKDYFAGFDAFALSGEQITAIVNGAAAADALANALVGLGGNLAGLPDIAIEARIALADLFGGVEGMVTSVGNVYQLLLSDEEKLDRASLLVNETLGRLSLTLPETNRGFLDLLESLDLTDEAGQAAYKTLIDIAPAFKMMTDAAALAGDAITTAAEDITQAVLDLSATFSLVPSMVEAGFSEQQALWTGRIANSLPEAILASVRNQDPYAALTAMAQAQGYGLLSGYDFSGLLAAGPNAVTFEQLNSMFDSNGNGAFGGPEVFAALQGASGGGPQYTYRPPGYVGGASGWSNGVWGQASPSGEAIGEAVLTTQRTIATPQGNALLTVSGAG